MNRIRFKDRFRYHFDNLMARGTITMIAGLLLLSALLILSVSLLAHLSGIVPDQPGGQRPGLIAIVWMSLMRSLDAGTMGNDQGNWPFLLCMLFVTSAGIFVISALTGLMTNGIQIRLERLRKGRSFVVERNHVVILGWSDQIFTVIAELAFANRYRRRFRIVVLAERDKAWMDDEIAHRLRHQLPRAHRLRVICRRGDPLDLSSLEIVNPHAARAIIVLSQDDAPDPDSDVIKTLLAIVNHPSRRSTPYHIVAALNQADNLVTARMAAGDEAELIHSQSMISRLAVQTIRQAGLSFVYHELLDFKGEDIYFRIEPSLAGKPFREAVFAYANTTLIGLRRADGQMLLNPPVETLIYSGDHLIVLSQAPETIRLARRDGQIDHQALIPLAPRCPRPERILVLGWNQRTLSIIRELDNYVAPGSHLHLIADVARAGEEVSGPCAGLRHLACSFTLADTGSRAVLEQVEPGHYDYIMTMAYADTMSLQQADSRSLLTLLHLRDIARGLGRGFSIVSELLDPRNRELARITHVNDFIASHDFISLMLAQLSQNRELHAIFDELLSPEGSEIYLRPAGDYVKLNQPVNFYTVLEAALQRRELALGYLRGHSIPDPMPPHAAAHISGVVLNPDKRQLVSFTPADRIIVLAES